MNSISDLKKNLRKLHNEAEGTRNTICSVMSTIPYNLPHVNESLYNLIVPTHIIDQVLKELRKRERTPQFIQII